MRSRLEMEREGEGAAWWSVCEISGTGELVWGKSRANVLEGIQRGWRGVYSTAI